MNASLSPYFLHYSKKDSFEIQIVLFWDIFMPSQCLVFYRHKHISFINALIQDAIFVDEYCIELELLSPKGDFLYYYYYPEKNEYIKILEENSNILFIRKYSEGKTKEDVSPEFEIPLILVGET